MPLVENNVRILLEDESGVLVQENGYDLFLDSEFITIQDNVLTVNIDLLRQALETVQGEVGTFTVNLVDPENRITPTTLTSRINDLATTLDIPQREIITIVNQFLEENVHFGTDDTRIYLVSERNRIYIVRGK